MSNCFGHMLRRTQREVSEQLRNHISNIENNNASLQDKLKEAAEDRESKEVELQNALEDVLHHDRQRQEAEEHLTAVLTESQEREHLTLVRINSECMAFDEDIGPEADVETALETLFFCLQFARAQASLNDDEENNSDCKPRSQTPSSKSREYHDAAIQTLSSIRTFEVSDVAIQTLDLYQPEDSNTVDVTTQTSSQLQRGLFEVPGAISQTLSEPHPCGAEILDTVTQNSNMSPIKGIENHGDNSQTLSVAPTEDAEASQPLESSLARDTELHSETELHGETSQTIRNSPGRYDEPLDVATQPSILSSLSNNEAFGVPSQTPSEHPAGDDAVIQSTSVSLAGHVEALDIANEISTPSPARGNMNLDSQDRDDAARMSVLPPDQNLKPSDVHVNRSSQQEIPSSVRQGSEPVKLKRKANRHGIHRTKTNLGTFPKDDVFFESQIEETTIRRSVTRATSSHGGRSVTSTPSRFPKESSVPISTFSQFHQDVSQSLDPMSPMADMRGFFPPTPQKSSTSKPVPHDSNDDLIDNSSQESVDLLEGSVTNDDAPVSMLHQTERNSHTAYQSELEQVEESYNSSNIIRKGRVNKFAAMTESQAGLSRATVIPKGILKDPKGTKRGSTTAGLGAVDASKKMRIRPTESQGLGPIIADSQSTSNVNATKANPRARKSKRRATNGKCLRFRDT